MQSAAFSPFGWETWPLVNTWVKTSEACHRILEILRHSIGHYSTASFFFKGKQKILKTKVKVECSFMFLTLPVLLSFLRPHKALWGVQPWSLWGDLLVPNFCAKFLHQPHVQPGSHTLQLQSIDILLNLLYHNTLYSILQAGARLLYYFILCLFVGWHVNVRKCFCHRCIARLDSDDLPHRRLL